MLYLDVNSRSSLTPSHSLSTVTCIVRQRPASFKRLLGKLVVFADGRVLASSGPFHKRLNFPIRDEVLSIAAFFADADIEHRGD